MTTEPHNNSEAIDSPVFLVVDDDPMVRTIVARGLRSLEPAEILEEEDGRAAQQVLQSRRVDVVVTDVVMPHMDGLELIQWAHEHCPDPLFIVLSGLETFDAAVDALQHGAFDYLAKPPEVPRVRVAVRNALDQLELVRERERLYRELEASNVQLADKVEELEQVCRVLEQQATLIQADLDRAEIIQRALLPQDPPTMSGWCIETLYRPGSSVGGDFYDAVLLHDRYLALVIADAAGHGVAAAMLAVLFKLRLKYNDRGGDILQPGEAMARLNERLFDMLSTPGSFITAAYALIDLQRGEGKFAAAGHTPCILSTDGESTSLGRTGPALGLEDAPEYTEHHFVIPPGSRLLLYTDGVMDGGPHSPTSTDLATALGTGEDRSELLESLYDDALRDLAGDRDDITLLLLERGEGLSHFDDAAPRQIRAAGEPQPIAPTPAIDAPHLRQGTADGRGYISLHGSLTWIVSQALLDTAHALLADQHRLTLDLSACEHMDSTCLGTLHEIVRSSDGHVELQGVSAGVRQLFDELSMATVLARADSTATHALPDPMSDIETAALNPQQQGARILRAHELLADLSEDNRQQFAAVVDALQADLPKDEN